jgi:hypothetical protein
MCNCVFIEVFKTDVRTQQEADLLVGHIQRIFTSYKANFDIDDCDHILRIQSNQYVHALPVIELLKDFGYHADVLPDDDDLAGDTLLHDAYQHLNR